MTLCRARASGNKYHYQHDDYDDCYGGVWCSSHDFILSVFYY